VPNKETKRDRREAAKRARKEAERKAKRQRRKNKLYGVVAILAVAGLIAGIVLASKKSPVNPAAVNTAASAAGCDPVVSPPDQGHAHFPSPGQTFNYNSNPPTSGTHYAIAGVAPAPTGVHNAPIQDEYQVHNIEHGHIGIQYATSLSSDIRDALEDFTRSHPSLVFMAPRPTLPTGVILAFTAWDEKVTCESPTSASAVRALATKFFDTFQGSRSPEGTIAGTPIQ
jgi:hypothetical protein